MALGSDAQFTPRARFTPHEVVRHSYDLLDRSSQEAAAEDYVRNSRIIQEGLCGRGRPDGKPDPLALEAFGAGFGNFVYEFPDILDARVRTQISRDAIKSTDFGKNEAYPILPLLFGSVKTMRKEEADHKGLWWIMFKAAGVNMSPENIARWRTPEMEDLIQYANVPNVRQALAAALGTENVAGGLSKEWLGAPALVQHLVANYDESQDPQGKKHPLGWPIVHVSDEFITKKLGRIPPVARGRHDHEAIEHPDVDGILLVAHDDSPQAINEDKAMIEYMQYLFARASGSLEKIIYGTETPLN